MEDTTDEQLQNLISRLGDHAGDEAKTLLSERTISETSYHDFARYEYLVEPWTGDAGSNERLVEAFTEAVGSSLPSELHWRTQRRGGPHGRPEVDHNVLDREADPKWSDRGIAMRMIEGEGFQQGALPVTDQVADLQSGSAHESEVGALLIDLLAESVEGVLVQIARRSDIAPGMIDDFIGNVDRWKQIAEVAVDIVQGSGAGTSFEKIGEPLEGYATGSVNAGLRTVYRQVWSPIGLQAGEIVRTLPLGPKQSEKVTVKTLRRRKISRSKEQTRVVKETTESSSKTTDSSEIVREAAQSSKWHAEASVDASFGGFGASVSAGKSGQRSESSKEAKKTLNETMKSSARKVQSETKVVVSTEVERKRETTQVSEIKNPNDEIAVTYVYSRLQQQYKLSTHLEKVDTVLYVAEHLPRPSELDIAWFQLHGWIIRDVLLDENLEDDLQRVMDAGGTPGDFTVDSEITSTMEKVKDVLSAYKDTDGSPPDISTTQETYESEVKRKRERERERAMFRKSLERLRDHVSANLLHYMRAIWSEEDPDTRLMRLRDLHVPADWLVSMHEQADYANGVDVQLGPAATIDEESVPVSEIVDPAGPIGYTGNYSVWLLRDEYKTGDLADVLASMRLPYLRIDVDVSGGERLGRAFDIWVAPHPDTYEEATYRAEVVAGPKLELHEERSSGRVLVGRREIEIGGGMVEFGPLRIHITGLNGEGVQEGDSFEINVHLVPELEDPEVRRVRWEQAGPSEKDPDTFTDETIQKMSNHDDLVAEALEDVDNPSWENLDRTAKRLLRNRWANEVVRRRHTRRLLLETNNVLLTRVTDQTSSLEPFKVAHRYVDVLKAKEELQQEEAETKRFHDRIEEGNLEDPDAERRVLVDGSNVTVET